MAINLTTYTDIEKLHTVLSWIREPEELFGTDPKEVKKAYREWAKRLHPDAVDTPLAHESMARLNDLYEKAQALIKSNEYGGVRWPNIVKIKDDEFYLLHEYANDEISTDYVILGREIMRIPHGVDTNDLMMAEVDALTRLADAPDNVKLFFPTLIQTILSKTPDGTKRLNILSYGATSEIPEQLLTLRQLGQYYNCKLDPKQVAWIWRKLLVALDTAHNKDVVHGGISPDTLLIEPKDHLVCVTGWQFSTLNKSALVATSNRNADLYPSEINIDGKTTFGLDLYMGAKTMLWAGEGAMPDKMRTYFQWIANKSTLGRLQEAYTALNEFDLLIHELWGERKYTPMDDLLWPILSENI